MVRTAETATGELDGPAVLLVLMRNGEFILYHMSIDPSDPRGHVVRGRWSANAAAVSLRTSSVDGVPHGDVEDLNVLPRQSTNRLSIPIYGWTFRLKRDQ